MADPTLPQDTPATWWEQRYASGNMRWSGKPNDLLVGEVHDLPPARVLDLGCGTGGDAIWLASLGWTVTAVDIAESALNQGAEYASEAGVGERITWERHELETSFPAGEFDLVSACYLQSPLAFERLAVLRSAAGAVAPGGTLVVVSHESTPSGAHAEHARLMPTAPELLVDLELQPDAWTVHRAEGVARTKTTADGSVIDYRDNVLRIQRS